MSKAHLPALLTASPGKFELADNGTVFLDEIAEENFVKRQLILPGGDAISELRGAAAKETALQSKPSSLCEIGRRAAEQAEKRVACVMLEQTGWNRKESARRLQISYHAFLNRLRKWRISEQFETTEPRIL